ncbi:MarR family winged helix-turn-helix transcriptional regulator [Nocardia grenadensis]|uniref:MarR family winged helix-turn-helix transcriptional regulator n=1 Tax=Nocardia grenadensis TaxID=931537 RepID=UPI0007A400D8|nr:MarR family transcriptional regulator [Nocardia grenadensis]
MDDSDAFDVGAFAAAIEDFNRVYIRIPVREKLPFTTLSVLDTLAHGGPARLTDLTRTEQMTQPGVTQLIARLERDGLVLRRRDPGDGRAVIVHLTEAGRQVRQTRHDDRVRYLAPMISALSPADSRALAAALPALTRLARLEREH